MSEPIKEYWILSSSDLDAVIRDLTEAGISVGVTSPKVVRGFIGKLGTVLKGFALLSNILMPLWFIEEILEVVWAWYWTLNVVQKPKKLPGEIPYGPVKRPYIKNVLVTHKAFDGRTYRCVIEIVHNGWKPVRYYLDGREDDKVECREDGDMARFPVSTTTLPKKVIVWADIYDCREVFVPQPYPHYERQCDWIEKASFIEIRLTDEIFKDAYDEGVGNEVLDAIDEAGSYADAAWRAAQQYTSYVMAWIDDDEPTWKLAPAIDALADKIDELNYKAYEAYRNAVQLARSKIPDIRLPTLKLAPSNLPRVKNLPRRDAFELKLDMLWGVITEKYTEIVARLADVRAVVADIREKRASWERKWLATLSRYRERIAEARAEGDEATAARLEAELQKLEEEAYAEWDELRSQAIRDKLESLLAVQRSINDFIIAARKFVYLVTPKYEDLIKLIQGIKIKLPIRVAPEEVEEAG